MQRDLVWGDGPSAPSTPRSPHIETGQQGLLTHSELSVTSSPALSWAQPPTCRTNTRTDTKRSRWLHLGEQDTWEARVTLISPDGGPAEPRTDAYMTEKCKNLRKHTPCPNHPRAGVGRDRGWERETGEVCSEWKLASPLWKTIWCCLSLPKTAHEMGQCLSYPWGCIYYMLGGCNRRCLR